MRHARAVNQALRQELVERGQLHGAVANQLDHGAACAKGDDGAEGLVAHQANAHLASALCPCHGLHRDAVDARIRCHARHALHHGLVGIACAGGSVDVQHHTAHVGFVRDVGRVDFQRHRKAQLRGNHHGLGAAARQQRARDRDVEGRQQGFRLHLRQHAAPLGQHAFDHQARALDVGLCQIGGQRRGRLLQQLLVDVVVGHVAERAHGRFWRAEGGNVGRAQHLARRAYGGVAQPAREHGLVGVALGVSQGLGDGRGVCARFGREQGQDAIDLPLGQGRVNGGAVLLGCGVFAQVDQLLQCGLGRQQRCQRGARSFREHAQFQVQVVGCIGSEHAGAAAVGHHRQAPTYGAVARGQAFGGRKQIDKRMHAHGTGAAQGGIEHVVAADDGCAVRERRRTACAAPPRLEYHHRLGVGRRAQRTHEAAGVADALHAHRNAVGVRVVGEKVQRFGQAHAGVRAKRDHAGKAHAVAACPVQRGGGERARLADQRHGACLGQRAYAAGIELQRGALDAQRVGPKQKDALAPCQALQLRGLRGIYTAAQQQRRAAVQVACHL